MSQLYNDKNHPYFIIITLSKFSFDSQYISILIVQMSKKGKLEWDAAMEASGHRIIKEKAKKWTSRLRTNTKNTNVVDAITREQVFWKMGLGDIQILNERLEALERDNYEEEEFVTEADLYNEEEDVRQYSWYSILGLNCSLKTKKREYTS